MVTEQESDYQRWHRRLEEMREIERNTDLTPKEQSRLRVGLHKKAVSQESYLMALNELITVDEAYAIGYEDRPSILGQDAIIQKKANKVKTQNRPSRPCLCDCNGWTRGGKFLPGHDAKLKSQALILLDDDVLDADLWTQEQIDWLASHGIRVV